MKNAPDTRLQRIDRLATLLDSSIRIPGINHRIGYDAIIGLIPGIGDAAALALSTYIVVEAARYRLPKSTLLRMITNVALDTIIGAIPVVGDLFDAFYKANRRNIELLHNRLDESESRPGDDRAFFASVVLLPILVIVSLIGLAVWLLSLAF